MKQSQLQWIVSGDTGISSETMWAAINGVENHWKGVPHDPSDFGRCYRYVNTCCITREQMEIVKIYHPPFTPFIDNWDNICKLYESEQHGRMVKTYDYIKSLLEESYKYGVRKEATHE